MENRGLLFIPDISGFSNFVNSVEIEHSRMIIQELLEDVINANELGLEISEIEGDAVLFYKFGDAPRLDEIYSQVEKMFCAFHSDLLAYEQRRYCQCKACRLAATLSLKIITHYGEFSGYQVRNFHKLIGKDIIVAHQLLKNNIENHEYWLVTTNLTDVKPTGFKEWMHWDVASKETEMGTIPFHYTLLSDLKKDLKSDPPPPFNPVDKVRIFSLTETFHTDMITLLHAVGDFNLRSSWYLGVKKVEDVHHYLPRVGMRCRCIMDDDSEVVIRSSSFSFQPDTVEYTEREEGRDNYIHYTVKKITPDETSLTVEYYLSRGFFAGLIFKFTQGHQIKSKMQQSFARLSEFVKTLVIEKAGDV